MDTSDHERKGLSFTWLSFTTHRSAPPACRPRASSSGWTDQGFVSSSLARQRQSSEHAEEFFSR